MISFLKIRNNNGLSTEPWGTPPGALVLTECTTVDFAYLSVKYNFIKGSILIGRELVYCFSFYKHDTDSSVFSNS